jgi:site-specific recombinase XerD
MGMPTGDDLVDYRDRAILKVYLYTGIRLTTGCRLKVSDFHQDGEATLKLHEKGDKRRTIGLHFNAAQAIGEYIEVDYTLGQDQVMVELTESPTRAIAPRPLHAAVELSAPRRKSTCL